MKALLISPPNHFEKKKALPSLSLASLSGILKDEKVEHICVDGNFLSSFSKYLAKVEEPQMILDEIRDIIRSYQPALICISLWEVNIPFTLKLAEFLKNDNNMLTIIAGGIRGTTSAGYLLKSRYIDFVYLGEAETNFPKWIKNFFHGRPFEEISGILHGKTRQYAEAPVKKKLTTTPCYDFFLNADTRSLFIETSKGCIYNCVFCGLHHTAYRRISPKQSLQLLTEMNRKYGTDYFNFADNFIPMKGKWMEEFLDLLISSRINVSWSCLIRADNIDKRIVSKMPAAGCVGVFMGVESVSPHTLSYINKTRKTGKYIQELNKNIMTFASEGIRTMVSTIIGFPEETSSDMMQTVDFVKELKQKGVDAYTGPLVVYPGSQLWQFYESGRINLLQIRNKAIKRNNSGLFNNSLSPDPIITPNDFIPENKHMDQVELEGMIEEIMQ